MAAEKMTGTWELKSSDQFNDYMIAIGVGWATRLAGNLAKPTVTMKVTCDSYFYKSESTFRTLELKCKIGEEIDEETPDGRKVKTTFTWKGDRLVQTQKWDGKSTTITRYMEEDNLILECKMGDVMSRRVYERA